MNIPVDPGERKFEPGADWVAWAVHSGAPWAAQNAGTLDPEDERRPQDFPSGCTYTIPEAATVALFADFGCGLAPARYIARQIVAERAPVAVHLGDVYYAGRAAEVDAYMKAPMEPLMDSTDLFLLAGNHDLYDRGRSFHRYLDSKRLQHPATQRQEAEVFRLVNSTHQILGLDTEWWRPGRMKPDHVTRLRTWAEEGRAAGKMNILLTSDHPYDFGDAKATRLWADVKPVVGAGLVDLWFWGNVHHAALYGSNERFPFTGSCIGWGGFPDERLDASKAKKTAAPVRWAEYAWRYAPWRLREDRVNNGWCRMRLVPGGVQLEYVDWMGRLRAEATVKRAGGITALTAFDP